jgi:SlyX protein
MDTFAVLLVMLPLKLLETILSLKVKSKSNDSSTELKTQWFSLQNSIKFLRFRTTTLLWFSMKEKESINEISTTDEMNYRIQILEEKFEYQDRTIDALNEMIIEQQTQINSLEDQILRIQALFSGIEDNPSGGEDPPPPHY